MLNIIGGGKIIPAPGIVRNSSQSVRIGPKCQRVFRLPCINSSNSLLFFGASRLFRAHLLCISYACGIIIYSVRWESQSSAAAQAYCGREPEVRPFSKAGSHWETEAPTKIRVRSGTSEGEETISSMKLRDIVIEDGSAWRRLWKGYCDFYRTALPPAVIKSTWERIVDPKSAFVGRIAELDGEIAGFSLSVIHECSWTIAPSVIWKTSM